MHRDFMDEARRLYDLGFGVHWLKRGEKGKEPVTEKWQKGTRQSWEELERTYKKGYGLGVRLGRASKIKQKYLANIDVDFKDSTKKDEALAALETLFPGLLDSAPLVKTGNGLRLLVKTEKPARSFKMVKSKERIKTAKGMSSAWEIEFMSVGRQVVLPPSMHPETGTPYTWKRGFTETREIPLIKAPEKPDLDDSGPSIDAREVEFVAVDLDSTSLSEKWVAMIRDGEGVDNASDNAMSACMAMKNAGFTDAEILSVMTDRKNVLGRVGYKHRKTRDRRNAADWVAKYCIKKASKKVAPENMFRDAPIVEDAPKLSAEEAKEQQKEMSTNAAAPDWKAKLKRKDKLKSVVMILRSEFGGSAFAHNELASKDYFTHQLPWAMAGETLRDIHLIRIKYHIATKYNFEPSITTIDEAVMLLCNENKKNPAKEFFHSLPPWDGVPIIQGWLQKYFGAEGADVYIDEVFRKWMVAAVYRVFEPGTKFDWIPIFEGRQGLGKSLFGRLLFGEEFFSDQMPSLDYAMADAVIQMQGKLCIELAELSVMKKSTLEGLKAFITRQTDEVRRPFARKAEPFPRQCVFYGTTDKSVYLTDEAGNRRFNPIKVGLLNNEALKRDRLKLWSEAYFIYQNFLEDNLYLSKTANIHAEETQKEKTVHSEVDHFQEITMEFIEEGLEFPWELFRISDLFTPMGPLGRNSIKFDAKNSRLARETIKRMGAKMVRTKICRMWALDGLKIHKKPANQGAPTGVMLN